MTEVSSRMPMRRARPLSLIVALSCAIALSRCGAEAPQPIVATAASASATPIASSPPRAPAPVYIAPPRQSLAQVPRAASPLGLTASDGTGLHLTKLVARAVVDDPLAYVELTLSFENPSDRALEGTFAITLPPNAAVSRFAMKVPDGIQEGEVVELQAARRAYEDFLHRKQDPALLEQGAGNQFTARVFPIPAHGVKELVLSYSQTTSDEAPFAIPLGGLPEIGDIDVEITQAGSQWPDAALVGQRYTPTGDVGLDPASTHRREALRSGELALVRVRPVAETAPAAIGSTLILVDTSASRALGFESELHAVSALAKLVGKGDPSAHVAIVAFDQTVEEIYSGRAVDVGDGPIGKLRDRQALGASNLEQALAWAHAHADGAKRILLVTDGVVTAGNEDTHALAGLAGGLKDVGVDRLDVVAIGGIRDDATLKSLATAGLPNDGVVVDASGDEASIGRRLTHATRSHIDVAIDGATFVWPRRLDGMQAGDTAIVFAEVPAATPLHVSLGGVAIPAPEAVTVERPLLERAWAQAKIASLVGAARAAGEPDPRQEIVALSVSHRVLSPFTGLLVLESEEDYDRFKIDRRALTDVMTIDHGKVALAKRDGVHAPQRPTPLPTPAAMQPSPVASASGAPPVADPAHVASPAAPPIPAVPPRVEPSSAASAAPSLAAPKASSLAAPDSAIGVAAGDAGLRSGSGGGPVTPGSGGHGLGGIGSGASSGDASVYVRVPVAEATVGAASGGSNVVGVDASIARIRWKFKACLTKALAVDPTARGTVRVQVRVARDGTATASIATSDASPSLGQCVARAFDSAVFSPPDGGSATFFVPIVLRAGEGGPVRDPALIGALAPPPQLAPPIYPPPYEGNLKVVMALVAKGDAKSALEKARAWRSEAPGDVLALVALGEAFEASKDEANALRAYGSIIDLFPSRADLRRFAGVRLEHVRGGLDLALDTFTRAAKQRPDHPHGSRLLAYALVKKGLFGDAFDTIVAARKWPYGDARFPGVDKILSEDLGLIAAAWTRAEPKRAAEIRALLKQHKGVVEDKPSIRFVLNWETDANDVDFHIYDDKGGHAFFSQKHLPSGGDLYADVTTGYGPECFTIRGPKSQRAKKYTLQANYYSRGPMGYGMGKIEILEHDGRGGLTFEERPYVVMIDHGFVDLGTVTKK
jgi:tetratricopeptide (TPR) repeat protein